MVRGSYGEGGALRFAQLPSLSWYVMVGVCFGWRGTLRFAQLPFRLG